MERTSYDFLFWKAGGREIKFSKIKPQIDFISPNQGLSRQDSTIGRRAKHWIFDRDQRNVSLTSQQEGTDLKQEVDFLCKPSYKSNQGTIDRFEIHSWLK